MSARAWHPRPPALGGVTADRLFDGGALTDRLSVGLAGRQLVVGGQVRKVLLDVVPAFFQLVDTRIGNTQVADGDHLLGCVIRLVVVVG